MTALSLRMPEELERRLDMEARRAGVPRSEIARTAIEELLNRRERERYLAAFVAEARATYGDAKIRELRDAATCSAEDGHSANMVVWFTDTTPGVPKDSQSLEALR